MALTIPTNIIPSPDLDAVRVALATFFDEGQTFEIRVFPSKRSHVTRSIETAVQFVRSHAGESAVFWCINPVRHDLTRAASDRDVIERRWFMVDVDPVRAEEDSSATDAERAKAHKTADAIRFHLENEGWPDPVIVDSGNGVQLLYRVDMPANAPARIIARNALQRIADLYTDDNATVDMSVYSTMQLARLPGTWNRKGQQSPSRPYRLASIVRAPESPQVVTVEQLMALAPASASEVDRPALPAPMPSGGGLRVPMTLPTGADVAWYRKALENECAKVMLAPNGHRHDALKNASVTLAGHLWTGAYSEVEMRSALMTAGLRAGLPEREIEDLLRWGVEHGTANPLPRPAKLDAPEVPRSKKGKALPEEPDLGDVDDDDLFVRASTITPREVRWLWQSRIPLGKMTTFAGQGGLGKTMVLCDLAARVSAGHEWPLSNGECAEPGDVLFISGEDDEDDTLVPRMIEAGADRERIVFLSPKVSANFHLAAVKLLERIVDRLDDTRLIVVDPPASYMAGVDDHKNAEIRSILTPLKLWASQRSVAIIFNTHVNKAVANLDAASRVMGSAAWVNAVRAAHMFVRDSDDKDRVIFAPIKMNVGKRPMGMTYRIVQAGNNASRPRIEWIELVDQTADEALAGDKRITPRMIAAEWLVGVFAGRRQVSASEISDQAKLDQVDRNTWQRAARGIGIRPVRIPGITGHSEPYWVAPEGWPPPLRG